MLLAMLFVDADVNMVVVQTLKGMMGVRCNDGGMFGSVPCNKIKPYLPTYMYTNTYILA